MGKNIRWGAPSARSGNLTPLAFGLVHYGARAGGKPPARPLLGILFVLSSGLRISGRNGLTGLCMKLFRRTHWKPTQKLRKEDFPFLLAEYRVANTTSFISLTLFVSLIAIAAGAYFMVGSNPDIEVRFLITSCVMASLVFLFGGFYLQRRSSQIAEVLQIKKRLKRYGIKD